MTVWTAAVHESGDVRIHYLRTGGSKPPLLMLHGLTSSGACWTPVARALEDQFDVLMPDARGHGASSAPPAGYRYEHHARDVLSLAQGLGLTSPVLLGHSMGGMTAAVVASQPEARIRGLVLADPTFLEPQRQRQVYAGDAREHHAVLLARTRDQVLADLRRRHPHRSPEILELLATARLQARLVAFDVLRPPNPDYHRLVGAIRVPTLLLLGDAPVVSVETARALADAHAHVTVRQIADAGHGLHFDQPGRFAASVAAFLGALDPPGSV
jgi:N-formylmaleamate deformylase